MSAVDIRRDKVQRAIRSQGADALLVTNFTNVTYLTGFTGDDSYLLVSPDKTVIISDPRYTTQLEEECPGLERHIRPPGQGMVAAIAAVCQSTKARKLGVEGDSLTLALAEQMRAALPKCELVSTSRVVEDLREIKDKDEIAHTREAIHMAERAFAVLRATLRPDATEKQVADALENQLRLFGAKGSSFPPIVAVGDRAALPHARPTEQLIGAAPFVLVDWGASGKLYKSDLTRVLLTGRIPPKFERIYRVVLEAQLAAIHAIKPGVSGHDVDAVARNHIRKAGYGQYFGHGLGHGIGLEIHEGPRLAAEQHRPLKPGMIVTVEPGIYLPGFGGVRIEDDVLVTKSGHEVLTSVGKDIESAAVCF
jgi:Xaa-Pro aminopeptidase